MTSCGRCLAPVPGDARFCSECGAWVVHPAPPAEIAPGFASSGGAVVRSTEFRAAHPLSSGGLPPLTPVRAPSGPASQTEAPGVRARARTVADERPPMPSRSLGKTPRPLGGFLVSYQYEPLGTFWPLGMGTNLVGRAGGGRPDADVVIADTTVSSAHALLEVDPAGVSVEDQGSRNGTCLNGRSVAARIRVPIGHGDRLRFGSFETIVVIVPYPADG